MTGTQNATATFVGLRAVRIALRDTDGVIEVPAGTATGTAYAGLEAGGAQALTLAIPEPQRVPATGDDRVYHTFQLPPTEGPSGELRVSKTSLDLIALLTGTNRFGSPPVRKVGLATDQQGDEPAIVLWGSAQGIDSEAGSDYFGQRVWYTYLVLNGVASLKPPAMEYQNVGQFVYAISGNDSTVDEFGVSLSETVHNFNAAAYFLIVTSKKFWLDAFLGDGAEVDFTLTNTPYSTATLVVAVDGAVMNSGWSRTAKVITFDSAPADGAKIIVEYEYE